MQVACCLLVIDELRDCRVRAADGARVTLLDRDGMELHRLGVEGQQAVGQQLTDTCDIFQSLGSLDRSQHTGDGS